VMLAMATPQAGQHHDLFDIQLLFEQMCTLLKQAGINLQGLFLNADPGFDSDGVQKACQKQEMMANVKPNPRIGTLNKGKLINRERISLMKSFIKTEPSSSMRMLGELHTLCSFGNDGFKAF
jgi:hypothetical protein